MELIDLKEYIKKLNLDKILCESFSKKTNMSKESLQEAFNHILEKEIDNIGKAMKSSQDNPKDVSRLQGLSLEDFMKSNDKIIKDK